MEFKPNFLACAVGSMPHSNASDAVDVVLDRQVNPGRQILGDKINPSIGIDPLLHSATHINRHQLFFFF